MTMRRRGRRTSRRSPRKILSWFNNAGVPAAIAIGAQGLQDLLPIATLMPQFLGGLTVLRMIGTLELTAQTADQDVFGSLGIAVMTRDAFAGAAVPDPILDHVDWYYQQNWFNNESRVGDLQEAGRTSFDIRTARRIRGEDRLLAAVFENSSASAAAIKFRLSVRLLLTPS